MKLKIITGIIISSSLIAVSCSDWLDVKSKNMLTQKEMFSKPDGFRTALHGSYNLLSQSNIYGERLSWGMASLLGNNYDTGLMLSKYRRLASGMYLDKDARTEIDDLWGKSYNAIANLNDLIQHTEEKEPDFFEKGELEYNMLLGEARGLRGMMYLDLLRTFAPAPIVDDGKEYIRYSSVYPEHVPIPRNVDYVMNKIIEDLEFASQTLADVDTLHLKQMINNISVRYNSKTSLEYGAFFVRRGNRMNYFAATALLARAYLYKGDKVNAARCAEKVLKFSSWFPYTVSSFITGGPNKVSRKLYDDTYFSLYNTNLYKNTASAQVAKQFIIKNDATLFTDADDYRLTEFRNENNAALIWLEPEQPESMSERFEAPLIPIIRRTEVVYILCECIAGQDMERATSLLQDVRVARGAKTPLPVDMDEAEFLEILYNECTREFLTYGQTFYLYKRLNRKIFNGSEPLDMTGKWVLPMPDREVDY